MRATAAPALPRGAPQGEDRVLEEPGLHEVGLRDRELRELRAEGRVGEERHLDGRVGGELGAEQAIDRGFGALVVRAIAWPAEHVSRALFHGARDVLMRRSSRGGRTSSDHGDRDRGEQLGSEPERPRPNGHGRPRSYGSRGSSFGGACRRRGASSSSSSWVRRGSLAFEYEDAWAFAALHPKCVRRRDPPRRPCVKKELVPRRARHLRR